MDLSDLSVFERGEDLPLADAAARIIAVLDISFAELVEGITWNLDAPLRDRHLAISAAFRNRPGKR